MIDIRGFLELPGFEPLRRPDPGTIEVPEQTPVADGDCGRHVTLPDGNVFTVGVRHYGPKEVHIAFDREAWPMMANERREITVGVRAGGQNCAEAEEPAGTINDRLPRPR